MRSLLLSGLVALVASLWACRSAPSGPGVPAGTWTVVELSAVDLAPLQRKPELELGADGALSGFSGVNRFSGRAELGALEEGHWMAGPLAATRMAGPPEAMAAEARFFELLAAPLEWRRAGAELTLVRGDEVLMRLAPR